MAIAVTGDSPSMLTFFTKGDDPALADEIKAWSSISGVPIDLQTSGRIVPAGLSI